MRTDFLPKEIAKTRLKTRFNTNKSNVAQIPCITSEILNLILPIKISENIKVRST